MKIENSLDLKELIMKYRPWRPIFLICIALALAAAYLFNTISEPVFHAKTTIMISEDRILSPLMPDLAQSLKQEGWHNEKAILQSHTLVQKALRNMDSNVSYYRIIRTFGIPTRRELYQDAPFRVKWDSNHPQPFSKRIRLNNVSEFSFILEGLTDDPDKKDLIHAQFGTQTAGENYSFKVEMAEPFNKSKHGDQVYEFIIHSDQALLNSYLKGLKVEPMGKDYSILEVTFKATHKQRAIDFITKLTSMYIQQNLEDKNQMAQSTIFFIDNQLGEVSDQLKDTELRLQQFRQRHQVMEVGPVATQLSEELKELDRQKSIEEVKWQYYDLLMEYVRDDLIFSEVFGPSALGIDDPLLNSLLLDLSNLHNERARMLLTTTINTPSLQAIDESIKQAKANLKQNIQSLKAANKIMTNDLNQRIIRIERQINQLPQTERELVTFQRMFNLNEATYNYLMEKRAEAGIGLASIIPDHRIVDNAHLAPLDREGLVAPKKVRNYALAMVLGMIVPFIFLFLRDLFNTRIVEIEDINRVVDYPIVGLIPHYHKLKKMKDPNPVLFDEIQSPIVEAFRSMRSNLLLMSPESDSKLILVTSTREKEGKTFAALKLAGSLHLLNRKTIYVNTDMRKPSDLFHDNISRNIGLANYLTGEISLDELLFKSEQNDNLNLIPSGKMPPNAAELLQSEAMNQLLERLKTFEYIVVDTPPIGLVSDAKPLLARADIFVYIFRHGHSLHSDLDFLQELSRKANLKKIALVVNDVKKTRKYGYGYGYGYGLGYGIGYGSNKKPARKKTKPYIYS